MNPNPLLLLVPLGVVLALGGARIVPHSAPPLATIHASVPPMPKAMAQNTPAPLRKGELRGQPLRFEEYLGKDPSWFEKRFGPADGGRGIGGGRQGGPAPLQWRTYDRRPDLGGGTWQMADAIYTYELLKGPQGWKGKSLAVLFESRVGGKPVATRVSHGVDPTPSRGFEQEAAYVGIDPADYVEAQPDRSNAEDRRMVNRKHPEIVLTANDLNETWHISLQIDPARRK